MRRIVGLAAGLLLVGACTTTEPLAATTAPTTTPTTVGPAASVTSAPADPASSGARPTRVVEVVLAGGRAEPNAERLAVDKGTVLELRITSDHADALHVHGYDVEIAVAAGVPVTKRLVLDRVGRFEVESHEPPLTVLQLVVS